ncbi:unnamed protein product [Anisakis simplex]|uniref:E3 ubiquitin-protein ligase n=1 Tax=Anisakis simplex TaxID=6269 RepID=A0A0M3K0I3_ANISI|nr:unnamed protein product [Anisakis simplex]
MNDFTFTFQLISLGVVEFLRPLALFYHAITLVPPPEALKDPSLNEFDPLCRYLGLPNQLIDMLRGPCVQRLFAQWSLQQTVVPVPDIVNQPVLENRLVKLPQDFADLINDASTFKCPSIQMDEHVSSIPTLCLKIKLNLIFCSFDRIRDSQVILLTSRARGCFHAAPYVDEFGETDFGFRRGNPLHLNEELYAKLEHIWLHQSICEEVVDQYEIDQRNIAFEWQHF